MRLNPRSSHLQWLIYLLTALFLASCATPITERTHRSSIGPFSTFSARLIVIEPAHRWQVLVDWDAPTAAHGTLRLTHAASNTVIEFRWQGRLMYIRDGSSNAWRSITTAQLAEHGIFIHPARLAAILSGQMPADFHGRCLPTSTPTGRTNGRAGAAAT